MFLSDKQGKDFKKIFNTNVKCSCRFICTCNLTEKPNKIIEGFGNEAEINNYNQTNQMRYSTQEETNTYTDSINKLENAHKQYNETAKSYIENYNPSSNIDSIKKYLNKNVQVTDIGKVSYNFKKCISNDSLNKDFNNWETFLYILSLKFFSFCCKT